MRRKNRLVIFDLDGTLFDTSQVNYRAYRDAAEKYGFQIKEEIFMDVFPGRNYKDFLPLFEITDQVVLEKIHDAKRELYHSYLSAARLNGHLFYILKSLKDMYQTALATTASRKNTLELLQAFSVAEYFDLIIAQEDVKRLKPDPECYLEVMRRAGVRPENTLIFEDSEVGAKAAAKSGASVCQIKCF